MTIDQQVQALNGLTQIMHNSARGRYEALCCEFEYEIYEGGWSVGSKYSVVRGGQSVSEFLDDANDEASRLVHQLHELMKSQTGGSWKSFLLTVDSGGRATTKFAY